MITVHVLSPQNEVRLAERLAGEIAAIWPEVASDLVDRIDLLVGVRNGTDVDVLLAIDFAQPRALPGIKRVGAPIREIASGLIVIEIKQLDPECFERIGNQIYSVYRGKRSDRSCVDQARDGSIGIANIAKSSGYPRLFVHALAWLTELPQEQLRDADPAMIGRDAGIRELLVAALEQHRCLGIDDHATRAGVRAVRARLLNRPVLTALDRAKTDRASRGVIARDVIGELAPLAGQVSIRLAGHGGSGKTTALIMLAARLVSQYGARVVILTYHHALCGDIRHVIAGLPDAAGISTRELHVETATDFLLRMVAAAGMAVPIDESGVVAYGKLDTMYREVAAFLSDPVTADALKAEDHEALDWDHVMIDEAQDWTDAERDLLLAAYGHRRLILADGLAQLVNRQTACNWLHGVPKSERRDCVLDDSLRMQRNVATFANAFAAASGFANWQVNPRVELSGGRIAIVEGELDDPAALVAAIGRVASAGKADPIDNLICVPPTFIGGTDDERTSSIATAIVAAGGAAWDACNRITRTLPATDPQCWRVIQYASCRGLEGWATLLVALDDLYANKVKYPISNAVDATVDPHLIARRWLLIPLTRAVHLLVIHVRDPQSPVAGLLREASAALPTAVVEWYAASEVAAKLQ